MDVGEDYTMTKSLISYSTTMSGQRVVNTGDKVIYKARCGTRGMGLTNAVRQEHSTNEWIVPAVYHDQIREELIVFATEDGAYGMYCLLFLILHC